MRDTTSLAPIRTDNRPLYTQAIDSIRELILSGDYKVGDRLPKESTLANQLGISRSTLRVAMGYLETCGLISRRPSVGTFVATLIPPNSKDSYLSNLDRFETLHQIADRTDMDLKVIFRDIDEIDSNVELASAFGISKGDPVVRLQIVESINDKPAAYLDTYIANGIADIHDLANYQDDPITYLSLLSNFAPSHTRSEIWAKNATKYIAEKLDLTADQAVLYLQETFHTKQGNCVALSHNYFISDIFHFYIIRKLAQ